MNNAIIANIDQLKTVDGYLLKDYEAISDDGLFVNCTICNTPRYEKKHSRILGKDYWSFIERDGRYLIPHLSGCKCQQEARHRIARERDGRWKDSKDPKNGNNTQEWVEGNHSDINYDTKRYIYSIPKKYRNQWIESSVFWSLEGEAQYSYQTVRNMVENAFAYGEINDLFFLHGGWHATALICALRNAFIRYGFPAICMDTKTILFHMTQNSPMAEELENVPMLLMMFTDPLSNTGSEVIHKMMEIRELRGGKTMFSSESSFDTVCCDWVSDAVAEDIFKNIKKETNALSFGDGSEDVPF